ncbi:MAG: hypothetical protein WD907_02250 [Bacilli bacterium]
MSIYTLSERSVVILRPTSSALVRDMVSFRQMYTMTGYIIVTIMLFSSVIAFSPLGEMLFVMLFGAQGEILEKSR